MINIKNIIDFVNITLFSIICFITLLFYNNSFLNSSKKIYNSSYIFSQNTKLYNTISYNKKYSNDDNEINEIYVLKQQRKIYIDLLKNKNLDYMKNTFLNKINEIDMRLLELNANMDDIDIIII